MEVLPSVIFGGLLALLYGVAAYYSMKDAAELTDMAFIKRGLGGMLVRIAGVLLALILIIKFVPVHLVGFIIGYAGGMAIALAAEVFLLKRHLQPTGLNK